MLAAHHADKFSEHPLKCFYCLIPYKSAAEDHALKVIAHPHKQSKRISYRFVRYVVSNVIASPKSWYYALLAPV